MFVSNFTFEESKCSDLKVNYTSYIKQYILKIVIVPKDITITIITIDLLVVLSRWKQL